jgi:PhoPQ-activated pathogenicity-related protein|tara:strand:+ start:584 stop:1990 length:1407 start_codon:yes stop_codon:yes gene_type:complete
MKILTYPFLIFFLLIFFSCSVKEEKNSFLLKDYVMRNDDSFRYEVVDTIVGDNWKEFKIKMVSGRWMSVNEIDSNEWWHWVSMVIPDDVQQTESMMIIGAGSADDQEISPTNELIVQAAIDTKSIISEVTNIPFQPIDFKDDGKDGRYEDDLIAYGWRKFLEGGAQDMDSEWLARFPMTRAVVKAMDVVQEINKDIHPIDSFFVTGASKRGWTTWTTAVVDDRVIGIAPIVIDLLNVVPSFTHHWRVYGEWSLAIEDYIDEGIMEWMGSKEYNKLLDIVDPYSYRKTLKLPKFIINATNDEFFVTDSWKFYWNNLAGEKHIQYIPNTDHGLNGTYKLESLVSFYNSIISDTDIPKYDWKISNDTIYLNIDPKLTYEIHKWEVINQDNRDFRKPVVGESWESFEIEKNEDGNYVINILKPDNGYKAALIEIIINPNSDFPFTFTSGTLVLPDVYPFPPFVSDNPKGTRK